MYKKMFLGLFVCSLITVLLCACAIRDASTTANTGPAVHMGGASFLQSSVTIHKGDSLNLIDDVASTHIITNGSWVNGTQVPKKEAGAPTVNITYNGNDSSPIGPFTTAGTFHVYCTVHSGMNLTIVVQ
jgi:plastocyanin